MTLRRTVGGLRSLHVFHGVDIVIFCEGGTPLTYEQAILNKKNEQTLDTLYWSRLVSSIDVQKRCCFKSAGSKTTLLSIAKDVNDKDIDTIKVCIDRDYDYLLDRFISVPSLAYSYGYSWENDVIGYSSIANVLSRLLGSDHFSKSAVSAFLNDMKLFDKGLKRWIEIDIELISRSIPGVFDRNKPLSAFNVESDCSLRIESLESKLSSYGFRRGPRIKRKIGTDDVRRVCFGRLLARVTYHKAKTIILNLTKSRIEYELWMRLLVDETFSLISNGELDDFSTHIIAQRGVFISDEASKPTLAET